MDLLRDCINSLVARFNSHREVAKVIIATIRVRIVTNAVSIYSPADAGDVHSTSRVVQ